MSCVNFKKKAARLMLDADIMTPSAHMFGELGWLPFDKCVKYFECILIYKSVNGLAPTYISELFPTVDAVHSHNLRSLKSSNIYASACHSNSIKFTSITVWNQLTQV